MAKKVEFCPQCGSANIEVSLYMNHHKKINQFIFSRAAFLGKILFGKDPDFRSLERCVCKDCEHIWYRYEGEENT